MKPLRLSCAIVAWWLAASCPSWADEPATQNAPQQDILSLIRGWRHNDSPCCPQPQPCPTEVAPAKPGEQPLAAPPAQPAPQQPAPAQPPATDAFSQAPSAGTAGAASYAPNMIGDQHGGGCGQVNFVLPGRTPIFGGSIEHPTFGCSRINIDEDNSPIPRDRVYFNYNHFAQASETAVFGFEKVHNIDRYTFGFEKTFLDGRVSLEARVPIAYELASDLTIEQVNPANTPNPNANNLPIGQKDLEIGNIDVIFKALLYQSKTLAFSSGFGLNLPTAPDVKINTLIQDRAFPVAGLAAPQAIFADINGVVHTSWVNLSPYVAGQWTPSERLFGLGFLQVDVPLNQAQGDLDVAFKFGGDPFSPAGRTILPTQVGDIKEQILMRLSLGGGYWIVRNPDANWLTGLAGIVEVHYTTALEHAKLLSFTPLTVPAGFPTPNVTIGNLSDRVDVVNLTLGDTYELCNRASLTTAFVLPLSSGKNKAFDWEFNLQFNWRFGPQDRATRAGL